MSDNQEEETEREPTVIGRPGRLADERERAAQPSAAPFYASAEEQAEYLARVYSDHLPEDGFDAVYGFGCHKDNELSVIKHTWLLGHNFQSAVLVLGREPYIIEDGIVGYSGEDSWRRQLVSPEGLVPISDQLISVPVTHSTGKDYNTLLESLDLINFVKSRSWNSLVIVAFPAHLPRAFASIVTAAKHLDWNGKIYAFCGASLRWDERVTHSHGTGAITRAQAVREEQKRLDLYCQNGKPIPLLRARELLEYSNRRDLAAQLETQSQNLGQ